MKSNTLICSLLLFFNAFATYADNIKGVVLAFQSNAPIQGAHINIFDTDSLIYSVTTDETGKFEVSLANGCYRIQVTKDDYATLEDSLVVEASDALRELKLILHKTPINLNEVVVKASPKYIKNLEDGIVYNLSKDKYAQENNLLNTLNRIPLLMVDNNGTISVAGKSSYVVYLNGKPYHIANADPQQVLRSIPSSHIKQVEVIMRPDRRFGERAPIINIITKGKSLEGYHLNFNGMGASTPKATGAASVLGMVNKVQLLAGYSYDFWGQRDQKWNHQYHFANNSSTFTLSNKNHYDRHTHWGRGLLQWDIDTLRQLYVDYHLNGMGRKKSLNYEQGQVGNEASLSKYLSLSDTWDASMEANIIYSSRFKKSQARKWRLGYRFTLNPDNRNYQIENLLTNSVSLSKTKGRLYTHNFQLFRRVNFTPKCFSYLTLNARIRKGSSLSTYINSPMANDTDEYSYTQVLGSLGWDFIWYMTKSNDLWLYFANNFEYANDKSTDFDSHRQDFNYLPSVKLTWQPNWSNELTLTFLSHINRPSLQMLNPFKGGETNNNVLQGSPMLKNTRTYSVALGYSFYGNKIIVNPTITGSLSRNAIMGVFDTDKSYSQIIETYSNVSKVKTLSMDLFLVLRPWNWLKFINVSSVGVQQITSPGLSLKQSDAFYRSTTAVTFNLPKTWQIEASFSGFKLTPKAWLRYEPGHLYSFAVSKTLMKGDMFVKMFFDCPFDKHGESDSRTNLMAPNVSYNYLYKVQGRCIGIELSINLRKGKKFRLDRNTSLKESDIQSGIAK